MKRNAIKVGLAVLSVSAIAACGAGGSKKKADDAPSDTNAVASATVTQAQIDALPDQAKDERYLQILKERGYQRVTKEEIDAFMAQRKGQASLDRVTGCESYVPYPGDVSDTLFQCAAGKLQVSGLSFEAGALNYCTDAPICMAGMTPTVTYSPEVLDTFFFVQKSIYMCSILAWAPLLNKQFGTSGANAIAGPTIQQWMPENWGVLTQDVSFYDGAFTDLSEVYCPTTLLNPVVDAELKTTCTESVPVALTATATAPQVVCVTVE